MVARRVQPQLETIIEKRGFAIMASAGCAGFGRQDGFLADRIGAVVDA
jgi:hypothetical protein